MTWKQDPLYMEPKPKKYYAIHCFTCKKDVMGKGTLKAKHQGHEVHYVNEAGEVDE